MDWIAVASAGANLVTSAALALAGLFAWSTLRAPRAAALPHWFAFALGCALCFLAADEGLELHDRVGRWLWFEHGVAAPRPINHVDDVIVMLYLLAGGLLGLAALPHLRRSPSFLMGLCASAALLAAGSAIDAFGVTDSWTEVPEESFEAAGAVLAAVVVGLHAAHNGALSGLGMRFFKRAPARPSA